LTVDDEDDAVSAADDSGDDAASGGDADCDGQTDENGDPVLCPENQTCFEGECRQNCNGNECVNAGEYCMPEVNLCLEPCVGVECAFGQLCNIDTIMCEDPCEGVDCPDPANRCWMGECVPNNCVSTGCEDGSICNGVECVPDPCIAANCPSGQFCREGQCIPSCAQVSCDSAPAKKWQTGTPVRNPNGVSSGYTLEIGELIGRGRGHEKRQTHTNRSVEASERKGKFDIEFLLFLEQNHETEEQSREQHNRDKRGHNRPDCDCGRGRDIEMACSA
jgi:hypothetical protein